MDVDLPPALTALLNLGGAVVVCFLFLYFNAKQQHRAEELVKTNQSWMDGIMSQVDAARTTFLEHNRALAENFELVARQFHDDIRMLMDQHLEVTKENTRMLVSLKSSQDATRKSQEEARHSQDELRKAIEALRQTQEMHRQALKDLEEQVRLNRKGD